MLRVKHNANKPQYDPMHCSGLKIIKGVRLQPWCTAGAMQGLSRACGVDFPEARLLVLQVKRSLEPQGTVVKYLLHYSEVSAIVRHLL
jgi:hypothetical protein